VPPTQRYSPHDEKVEPVDGSAKLKRLIRDDQVLGVLDTSTQTLYESDTLLGAELRPESVSLASNYLLSSRDDRGYYKGVSPVSIEMRARPHGFAAPMMAPLMRYDVFLRFNRPLTRERSY
jgi:hypothetical protein